MTYIKSILMYTALSIIIVYMGDRLYNNAKHTLTHPIDKRLMSTRVPNNGQKEPCWYIMFDMECPHGDSCPYDHMHAPRQPHLDAAPPVAALADETPHAEKDMRNELKDFISTFNKHDET